jgi:hypothetical protein
MATRRGVALFLVCMAGIVCTLVASFVLFADLLSVSDTSRIDDVLSCQVPDAGSQYGYSTWSWLPPGKVCHYPDGSTQRPHSPGELAGFATIAVGLGLVFGVKRAAARRGRRR